MHVPVLAGAEGALFAANIALDVALPCVDILAVLACARFDALKVSRKRFLTLYHDLLTDAVLNIEFSISIRKLTSSWS